MRPNQPSTSLSLAAAACALALATAANAQTAASDRGSTGRDSSSKATQILSEVVVTGSRVITNSSNSPTPLTTIGVQQLAEVNPGTVADQLNDLPAFNGSRGQFTNPSTGNQGTGPAAPNAAANVLNLRNMGYTRTLVLFDGHRVAPIGPDGTVDVNTIPQLLLKRVDVVTGGASAVYGSDAVTGVVNFITDTHFNGFKANAQAGISNYGDDATQDVGFAGGTNLFGKKGHFEASYEYRRDPGIPHRSARPIERQLWTVQNPSQGAYGPFVLVPNTHSTLTTFGGLISGNNPLSGMEFSKDGALTPFVTGIPEESIYQSGGSGAYNDSTLKASLIMHQLYGRFDYDFTDTIHGYAALDGTYSYDASTGTSNTLTNPLGSTSVVLSAQDPFLPAQYAQQLTAAGVSTFDFGKTFTDLPAQNTGTWERHYEVNAGLDVDLGHGYRWSTAFIHGWNMQNTRQNANINTLNLAAALNATVNPANGQIACAVSLTQYANLYPGCQPLNPFGPTAESQAAINYVTGVTEFRAYTTMDDATTSLTGAPISTWAGPVNMALSGEWRRLAYRLDSSAAPNDATNEISCLGLQYNCKATQSAQVWAAGVTATRTPVSVKVGETALEFDAPLLKDVKLVKRFSLNGAARYMDYSTSGAAWAWKAGLVWQVDDQLTLRATRSRDIRAPTLNDLYLPTTTSFLSATDAVTHQMTGVVPKLTGGNPNLRPEVGYTSTAGLVYRPFWLRNLSLSADAFFINITNAIVSVQGNSQYTQTACAASQGASPLCELIVRPISCCDSSLANTATEFLTAPVNFASQRTEGADFEADYAGSLFHRPFGLRAFATYQPHIIYATPAGTSFDTGGVAFNTGAVQASPVWRVTVLGRFSPFHNFEVAVLERWRSSLAWGPGETPPLEFTMPRIASVAYTNLNLSYLFERDSSQTEVYLNVTNLFNKQPPIGIYYNNDTPGVFDSFAAGDDPMGAYYTIGVRYRWY